MSLNKEGSFKPIIFVMILSILIASFWDKISFLKNSIHFVLDPTLGGLLDLNITFGMLIIVFIISLITILVQKYGTDQKTLKELKDQQKEISKKSKEFKHDPEKMLEIQKEMGPLTIKLFKLSMRPIMYTGVPFILLFRWFMDYFSVLGEPKFFGFLSWFWFYLIFAMVFGIILRKVFKVV